MPEKTLTIHPGDNVAVALTALQKGEIVSGISGQITLQDNIPAKHKLATHSIPAGNHLKMYGVIVGKALQDISQGGLISTRNVGQAFFFGFSGIGITNL